MKKVIFWEGILERVMKILTAYCTDRGLVKEVNQDALLIKTAEYGESRIALLCVCDGMGGLAMGEHASKHVVLSFDSWFNNEIENILIQKIQKKDVKQQIGNQWNSLLENLNKELTMFGDERGLKLGTTCTAMLIIDDEYYIIHIGDSRIYEVADEIIQITHDHTLVAREIYMGRIKPEEAETDSRRSVLLQCIGATPDINPQYLTGTVKNGATYILCSDGFRHTITANELLSGFARQNMMTEYGMENQCKYFVELNKKRQERDNITVVVAHLEE